MKLRILLLIVFSGVFLACNDDDNDFENLEALRKTDSSSLINVVERPSVIESVFTNEIEISAVRQNNYQGVISFRLNSVNTEVDADNPGSFRTLDMNDNEIDLSSYVPLADDTIKFKIEFTGINGTQYLFYNLNADDSEWVGNKNLSYVTTLNK